VASPAVNRGYNMGRVVAIPGGEAFAARSGQPFRPPSRHPSNDKLNVNGGATVLGRPFGMTAPSS
jgi:acetyl-CoA acetyltransferase